MRLEAHPALTNGRGSSMRLLDASIDFKPRGSRKKMRLAFLQ